ncbi:MAG: phenylalanine--tRNA ligase subunit beta [Treponema sp.]|nr:phenylalanine--tRNA ligase subunit beta [Treponema sp.]MCL2237560.1 phenylalanine--tRNA ligase subunit beta [Treponema sp.]
MPKIEVNEQLFYTLAGCPGGKSSWKTKDEFEEALTCAKAELDEDSDKNLPESERTLKIELNDTNRPDLWATAGCARQLKIYNGGKIPEYPFFSRPGDIKKAAYKVKVEESVKKVRPFLTGFIARGKKITDPQLRDMIQTQEKLAWNFGRKRRSMSMGIYRINDDKKQPLISWPIVYKGADPDTVSFVPLAAEEHGIKGAITLREILKQHPKGREFAYIQEHEPIHPLLTDSRGAVLSYPPIINSNDLGAVKVGDDEVFVELTGTDLPGLTLAASIVACDFFENGFTIEPVEIEYDCDLPSGMFASACRKMVTPYYFQEPVFCSLSRIVRFLGEKISADECVKALARMGVKAEALTGCEKGQENQKANQGVSEGVRAYPPEYRNDFLHAADVAEDVMIGRSLKSFKPQRPSDATIGRLLPITLFSRQVKELLVGMGYQEMIYNYLGSRKDLVEKMRGDGKRIIRIFNPMTENYEFVRDSIIASLMASESISGRSVYPHKIFEVGKIAWLDEAENNRSKTRQFAGFLHAGNDANFNTAAAELQTLFYYISREYEVEESDDERFIPGRAAAIVCNGKKIGIFGEVHPEVLENCGVTVPCTAGEIDLDEIV